jgi:hypothetical protein
MPQGHVSTVMLLSLKLVSLVGKTLSETPRFEDVWGE